jgi:hypothetical protein
VVDELRMTRGYRRALSDDRAIERASDFATTSDGLSVLPIGTLIIGETST